MTAVLYVLHFDRAYHHARHYVGIAEDGDAQRRFREHLGGQGSPLVRAVVAAGIAIQLARTAPGDRRLERRWHQLNATGRLLCPICRERKAGIRQLRLPIRTGGRRSAASPTPLWRLAA
jgi:hypothetical protein